MNKTSICIVSGIVLLVMGWTSCKPRRVGLQYHEKPVIYLYPEEPTEVRIHVQYRGSITVSYPEYQNEWKVIAYPDGKLVNTVDLKEYSYLFWEGVDSVSQSTKSFTDGFVVKGDSTAIFLQEKLSDLGMLPKEYNEFIVYWYPLLKQNPYNFIHFAVNEEYNEISTMDMDPMPNSMLRVFMYYLPLQHQMQVTPQELNPISREGFVLVEWGGGMIRESQLKTDLAHTSE